MDRLRGKVAIITGGGSGIGRMACLRFAEEGAKVMVTDLDAQTAQNTAERIRQAGGDAQWTRLDIAEECDWQTVVARTMEYYGTVDILVNNADVTLLVPLEEMTVSEWDNVWAVNGRGLFLGCKHVTNVMRKQGGGAIVNLGSIHDLVGPAGSMICQASNGLVRMFTKGAAAELANYHIRVNSIQPSLVATPMMQELVDNIGSIQKLLDNLLIKRPAAIQEVVNAIVFLASDEASYITATELAVDGGYIHH